MNEGHNGDGEAINPDQGDPGEVPGLLLRTGQGNSGLFQHSLSHMAVSDGAETASFKACSRCGLSSTLATNSPIIGRGW